jgi:hypothetical protein
VFLEKNIITLLEEEIIEISHRAVIPMEFYANFRGIPKIIPKLIVP